MNIKKYNSFSTKDIKPFDMAIAFAYKGFDIHQYRNVGDYLRGV